MASPISPTTGQPVNFQTNVNRSKTKRWVEAKTYNYDGDEWGGEEYDDDYDDEPAAQPASRFNQQPQGRTHPQSSAANQPYPAPRYGDLPRRPPGQYAGRIATNPASVSNRPRSSYFDPPGQGDERRAFSANSGPSNAPYPTSTPPPFSPRESYLKDMNHESRLRRYRGASGSSSPQSARQPSMEPEYFSRPPPAADSRSGPYADPRAGPYPAPISAADQRSYSSAGPHYTDAHDTSRHSPKSTMASPFAAPNHGSREPSPPKPFPPRKSSLTRHMLPQESYYSAREDAEPDPEPEQQAELPAEAKALPFVRPADIYKRVAEEKERERRASEESSRPSGDETGGSQQGFRTPLESVAERTGEHAMANLGKDSALDDGHVAGIQAGSRSADPREAPLTDETSSNAEGASPPQDAIQPESDLKDRERENAIYGGVLSERNRQQLSDAHSLRHNPSAGFTSVVHQAFEDSQDRVPPTPSSTTGTSLGRSDSASASDISPIIERRSEDLGHRPISSSTAKASPDGDEETTSDSDPLPPPIRPGFRRDSRTPSPGNSPARQRPRSVVTPDIAQGELAALSTMSTPTQPKVADSQAKAIPQAESPTKGTVRDLAGKFEGRSPSTSPERGSHLLTGPARPTNQRLETFRPSLPGGWNSYNTSGGAPSPTRSTASFQSTEAENLAADSSAPKEADEDAVVTAGPPQPREEGYEISNKAFEALAAAGTALSSAFVTVTGTNQDDDSSDKSSISEPSNNHDVLPAREYPGGLSPVQEVRSTASSVPPTPTMKDGVHIQSPPQTGYFPPPLRPSKSKEPPAPLRPPILSTMSSDASPQDSESDRLRKEIFRTLSPDSKPGGSKLRDDGGLKELEAQPHPNLSATDTLSGRDHRDITPPKDGDLVNETAPYELSSADEGSISMPNATSSELPSDWSGHEEVRPRLQERFSWEDIRSTPGPESNMKQTPARSSLPPQTFDEIISPATIHHIDDPFDSDLISPQTPRDDNIYASGPNRPTIMPVTRSDEALRDEMSSPVAKDSPNVPLADESEADHPPATSPISSPRSTVKPSPTVPTDSPVESPVAPLADGPPEEHPARLSSLPTTNADIPFRDILGMNTPQERIQAYNSSRRQWASQDSGLAHWLQVTGSDRPEHHDLLNRNGRVAGQDRHPSYSHKPSPSRSKLPWIGASFGGSPQAPQAETGDSGRASSSNTPGNVLGGQQMQEEGKKLLQSAGKLGGKAGGAAKGLLAKGRSKWRSSSGGGEKGLDASQPVSPSPQSFDLSDEGERSSPVADTNLPRVSEASSNILLDSDIWSLSTTSSDLEKDMVSATLTNDKDLGTHQPIPAEDTSLKPPSYRALDEDVTSSDRLESHAVTTSQISLSSSPDQIERPSRRVSDMTRDSQTHKASPTDSSDDQTDQTIQPGFLGSESADPGLARQLSCRAVSSRSLRIATTADKRTPPMGLREDHGNVLHSASSGSHYSQPTPDQAIPAKSLAQQLPPDDDTPGLQLLVASLKPQRSIDSLASESIASDTDGVLRSGPGPVEEQKTVEVAQVVAAEVVEQAEGEDKDEAEAVEAVKQDEAEAAEAEAVEQDEAGSKVDRSRLGSERSPPYEEATPRYSAVFSDKEAEAAAEKSSLDGYEEDGQTLPAYRSPTTETAPLLVSPLPTIVPVADLSTRRRYEDAPPSSRPFSFVTSQLEDVLHQGTDSPDQVDSLASGLSLNREVGHRGIHPSGSPHSAPPNAPNIDQHLVAREIEPGPLPSQQRDYALQHRANELRSATRQNQADESYGHGSSHSKSGIPSSTSPSADDYLPQQPPHSAPLAGFECESLRDDISEESRRRSDSLAGMWQRKPGPLSSDKGSSGPVSPPVSASPSPGTGAHPLRSLSKSRSSLIREQQAEVGESQLLEDKRKERRNPWFRSFGQHHLESAATDEANRNQNALRGYQASPEPEAQGQKVVDGTKLKDKDGKLHKRSKPASGSYDSTKTEGKKNWGFLRLGGLFTKSSKEIAVPSFSPCSSPSPSSPLPPPPPPPPPQQRPIQRSASAEPPSAVFPGMSPALTGSVCYPQQHLEYGSSLDQRGEGELLLGKVLPTGGYYAPAQPAAGHQRVDRAHVAKKLDPDSFIGGLRLSEQRALEQARLLQNASIPKDPSPASGQSLMPPLPPLPPLPHSAPPTAQHFNLSPSNDDPIPYQQKPRAVSQRFAPVLRIDTSARRRKSTRRNQPPAAINTGNPTLTLNTPTQIQQASGNSQTHNFDQPLSTLPSMGPTYLNASIYQNPASNNDNSSNTTTTTFTVTQPNPIPFKPKSPFYNTAPRHHLHPLPTYLPTKSKSASHAYALDLHKRSRSPRDDTRGAILQQQQRQQQRHRQRQQRHHRQQGQRQRQSDMYNNNNNNDNDNDNRIDDNSFSQPLSVEYAFSSPGWKYRHHNKYYSDGDDDDDNSLFDGNGGAGGEESLMDPNDPARVLGTFGWKAGGGGGRGGNRRGAAAAAAAGVAAVADGRGRKGRRRRRKIGKGGEGGGGAGNGTNKIDDDDDDDDDDNDYDYNAEHGARLGTAGSGGGAATQQEKPWMIDLPPFNKNNDNNNNNKSTTKTTVSGCAGAENENQKKGNGQKKDEDEEEEIVMCSTAYPGQEWMPDMLGVSVEMR